MLVKSGLFCLLGEAGPSHLESAYNPKGPCRYMVSARALK